MFSILGCSDQTGNTVVARVNKEDILLGTLLQRLQEYQFDPSLNSPTHNYELKKTILNELIQEKIILQLAKQNNLKANPIEVQKVLQMTYAEHGTEPKRDELDYIKNKIVYQLTANELYNWVNQDTKQPSSAEMQAYFEAHPEDFIQDEQIRIQQIIVKNKEEAQKVLTELKGNVPFEVLVKKYSILPESSLEGDTGFVGRGMFDEKMEEVIYKLSPNSIAPIIQTEQGYHIVKILDKKQSKELTFDEVKDFIFQNLLQQKKEDTYNQWLEQKILQTNIERNHAILQQNTTIS
ncbi:MAG: peptidyl-prolyl cis-trans isomerase [Bdellovibrionales bacterium]|nr:peptidyl-prolyl cis-trans isomerase [Bdellovibrionales bacterium]